MLNKEAHGIAGLVAGGEIADSEARERLFSAGVASGLGELEVQKTIASAFRAGLEKPRSAPARSSGRVSRQVTAPASEAASKGGKPPKPPEVWDPRDSEAPDALPGSKSSELERLPFLWVRDFGEFQKPVPLRWLLRDLRTGKPFLRAGKCAVLGGDGGVGKGYFWLTLAVCVALGKDLFDTFRPEQCGRVAILAGEDDQQEIHHRLFRIANALGLGRDEIALVQERVGILPLAGEQVSLLALDKERAPFRTTLFERLVQQLADDARAGGFEWSFVGLDPLARFGAANVETDQGTATAFVQALESMAARLPGEPAIGVTHHSSATSVAQFRSNLRGVTSLRNAFRLAMILDAIETGGGLRGVLLRNDKNNLAPVARPLWLIRMEREPMGDGRWLETAGVLRRATDDEARELDAAAGTAPMATAEQKSAKKETKVREDFERDCEAVLTALPAAPDFISNIALDALLRSRGVKIGEHRLKSTLEHLAAADGGSRIIDLSGGGQKKPRQWARRASS
jgi:hypothetical protein